MEKPYEIIPLKDVKKANSIVVLGGIRKFTEKKQEKNLRDAKFAIVLSIKRIITEGLNILAINAPEQM